MDIETKCLMKKTHLIIILFVLGSALGSCRENEQPTLALEGVWIEQKDRSDTLIFQKIDGSSFFSLTRGSEIRNGNNLPKYGSGLYNYQINGDSISMLSLLSSCSNCQETYYFAVQGSTLKIGDFYQKNAVSPQIFLFPSNNHFIPVRLSLCLNCMG